MMVANISANIDGCTAHIDAWITSPKISANNTTYDGNGTGLATFPRSGLAGATPCAQPW